MAISIPSHCWGINLSIAMASSLWSSRPTQPLTQPSSPRRHVVLSLFVHFDVRLRLARKETLVASTLPRLALKIMPSEVVWDSVYIYIHTYIALHYMTWHDITYHTYITLHYIELNYITLHYTSLYIYIYIYAYSILSQPTNQAVFNHY